MSTPVAVITGGNAGIGLETAIGLARASMRVLIAARSAERGAAAVAEIRQRSGSAAVDQIALDLASLASIRGFADRLAPHTDRLDVLVLNAGVVMRRRRVTADGFEMTFGVNHLGHFALTQQLLPLLTASAPARIVVVSSDAHKGARKGLRFDDLEFERRRYGAMRAYCESKLTNMLFMRELARRLAGTGVTANALHPGAVATRLARDGDGGRLGEIAMRFARPFLLSPETGARTSIWAATAVELEHVTGLYFANSAPATPTRHALDDAAARRLWEISESLVQSRGSRD